MNEYATDEEQVEALKKWWAENGRYLVAGIAIGLAILFGWNGWKDYREGQYKDASAAYHDLLKAAEANSPDDTSRLESQLADDYSGTPYAALAKLSVAKMLVEKGDLATAEAKILEAIESSPTDEITGIARLRLAQVQVATGKPDEALETLGGEWPPAYLSLREEYRGDAWRALGKLDEARSAYDKALLTGGARSGYLQLKRDALGNAA